MSSNTVAMRTADFIEYFNNVYCGQNGDMTKLVAAEDNGTQMEVMLSL